KSLASEFHQDSVSLEEQNRDGNRVLFEPFVGVAPRRYLHLFQMVQRKTKDGRKAVWDRMNAQPRIYPPTLSYKEREIEQSSGFGATIASAGLDTEFTEAGGVNNA